MKNNKIIINNELLNLCLKDCIPIVRDNTVNFIVDLIEKNNYHSILEIGTAYGYSSHIWQQINSVNHITTLELNPSSVQIASQFLDNKKVNLININAFSFIPQIKYDVIFIDGPKSNQEKLVISLLDYLNPHGVIIIDNLYLNKIAKLEAKTKSQLNLINKVNNFKNWLIQSFKTFTLYDIDDGVGVIKK